MTDADDYSGYRDPFDFFPHLRGTSGLAQIRGGFRDVFLGQAPGQVSDLRRVLAGFPADAVLCDGLFFAAGLVHELGGPVWATFGDGPLPYVTGPEVPPFGPALAPVGGRLGRLRNRLLGAAIDRFVFGELDEVLAGIRRDLGLGPEPRHALETLNSPYLHARAARPSFDYPRALPPQVHFVGALRPDPPPAWTPPPWWAELDGRRPVVHVTQGSIRPDLGELLLPALRGLAGLDALVVATTGGPAAEDLGPLPANVRVAPFVPYDALLAHADVFVTDGGYSGVTLALHHGVPIVQAGTTEEKSEIGARIAWSGVGLRLRTGRPSPEQVRAAVERVLGEERFRAAARRVAAEMTAHDGPRETADLLESLAATQRPVPRAVTSPVPA